VPGRQNIIPNCRFNNKRSNILDTFMVELCGVKWYNNTNEQTLPKGGKMKTRYV